MALPVRKAGSRAGGLMLGITGEAGSGKTTLCASFPYPLFIDLEGGSWVLGEDSGVDAVDVEPVKEGESGRQDAFIDLLRSIGREKDLQYRTLVIDSWTRLSSHIEADILAEDGKAQSLMAAFGGYAKGRDAHVSRTRQVIEAIQWLQRNRGLHIVWVMHSKMMTVEPPDAASYTKFTHEGVKESVKQVMMACDLVGLLRQELFIDSEKGGDRPLVSGTGARELFCGSHPGYEIKSRLHAKPVVLPVELGMNPLADVMGGA